MPTQRDVYAPYLFRWTDAARPLRFNAGRRWSLPPEQRALPDLSGLGADIDLSKIPGVDSLINDAMAQVRTEAAAGAETAVGPLVKTAIVLSLAAGALSVIALVRSGR